MILEILLAATIETGLAFLVEAGFGDAARDLRDRLLKTDQKKRGHAFQQALNKAIQASMDETIQPLLEHRPFQEAVVKALLDPVGGMDFQAVAQNWGDKFPEHVIPLRRFFNSLQNSLLEDDTWGPILERYQTLRLRQDVRKALSERNLPVSDAPVVQKISAAIVRDGAFAQGDGATAVYIAGDYNQIVQVTIQQYLGGKDEEVESADARRRYLQQVSKQANLLPWTHLTTEYSSPDQGESLRLADVYIDLDTTHLRHVEREEELRQFLANQREMERIPALEIVNREPAVLLMGDPGSGKSTFIKHLAYLMAQAGLVNDPTSVMAQLTGWEHSMLLPVRVELRHLAAFALEHPRLSAGVLLLQYIHRDLSDWGLEESWRMLKDILQSESSGAIVLLDGLDEVPTAQRQLVVDAVNELRAMHPNHRYVVTCRPYAYVGQPWKLVDFHEVTLAPFSEEQIDRFIDNWYERLGERQRLETRTLAAEKARHLKDAVRGRDLLSLAERPLLLTVMAQLHTYIGRLPENRTQLYADTIQLLLQRWEGRFESAKGLLEYLNIPGLEMSDLEEGLYCVAFNAHKASAGLEGTADISEGNLCQWLKPYLGGSLDKAEQFVFYIRERAGLLIRHKTDAYTFPHRSFQEFLAACHWLTLTDYPSKSVEMIQADWERWREVFLLAAGHAARTNRLGQAIAAVNALLPCSLAEVLAPGQADYSAAALAGRALLEIGLVGVQRDRVGQTLMKRVQEWLVSALSRDDLLQAVQRANAGSTLARLDDPRFDPQLWHLPREPLLGFVKIPAGEFWMGSDPEKDAQASNAEKPQHRLYLPEYYLARYPVTVAQFRAFVEQSDYKPRYADSLEGLPNHPVVNVTWHEALAYCRWLDKKLKDEAQKRLELGNQDVFWQGLTGGGLHVALPSEAEWEKAARGTDGRIYPWGNEPNPERANYDETGIGTTSAVGCFPAGVGAYKLQDMSGNVWEWTRSLWGDYPYPAEGEDRVKRENLDASKDTRRVLRGGAFDYSSGVVRCACRNWGGPYLGDWLIGIRVVVSPFDSGL